MPHPRSAEKSRFCGLGGALLAMPLLALALATPPLAACGPWPLDARFWFRDRSGVSDEQLAAGALGVLDRGQRRDRLVLAYRTLSGLALAPASREAVHAVLAEEPTSGGDGTAAWTAARKTVPGAPEISWIWTERSGKREEGGSTSYFYFTNCLDDAFATAARTLAARRQRFGDASPEVREWLAGQDVVFARCQQGDGLPASLDTGWDPLLRQDREYQIAAALFYSLRFAEAAERFAAIAADTASPWSRYGLYLVGRARLRAGELDAAAVAFRAVLADPTLASLHESARGLLRLVAIRHDPAAVRRELAARLTAPVIDPAALADYVRLVRDAGTRAPSTEDDLGSWLQAMADPALYGGEDPAVAPAEVAARWRAHPTLPWLVAALAAADGTDFGSSSELLEAAAAVPATSPAFLTVRFHRARLLADLGRFAEASAALAPFVQADGGQRLAALARPDQNRLRLLAARLAASAEEYLRLSLVPPVEVGASDGYSLWGDDEYERYLEGEPLLPDDAVVLLNRSLPAAELARLARSEGGLPGEWRQRFFRAAATRALIGDDTALGRTLATEAEELAPELAEPLQAWLAAGDDRRFVAAEALLRLPGLHPNLRLNVDDRAPLDELDSFGGNWWCAGAPEPTGVFTEVRLPAVRFLTPAELAQARQGPPWPDLASGPIFLGEVVLAFARAHPDDPRVPEALHLVVRATRYGCGHAYGEAEEITPNGRVSKAAFELLHRRYPQSEWTAQTPYWFN